VIVSIADLASRYPEIQASPPETDGLDPRDAALAHAIYDATVRRWLTLSHIIGLLTDRPWRTLEPKMQAVLLVGSAQMLLLDRVPVHAAIDESVRWAKQHIRAGSAGFVNAVLRSVSRLVEAGEFRETWSNKPDEIPLAAGGAFASPDLGLPDDIIERLAIGCGLPERLVNAWLNHVGLEGAMRRAQHTIGTAPTVLRTRGSIPEDAVAHEQEHAAVWTGSREALKQTIAQGNLWVQDATSAGAIDSIADLEPELIVDLCAGLGTKTKQLRQIFPRAQIVAADPDPIRAKVLAETFEGDDSVRIVGSLEVIKSYAKQADLVLTDVPCSNSGVLARRVEARHRTGRRTIDRLVKIQRQILRDAVALSKPGGKILYATCSLELLENQKQATWAGRELGLIASRERLEEPARAWQTGRSPDAPDTSYRDGGYSVLLSPDAGP